MPPYNGQTGFIYPGRQNLSDKVTFRYRLGSDWGEHDWLTLASSSGMNGEIAGQDFVFTALKLEKEGFSCELRVKGGRYENRHLDLSNRGFPGAYTNSRCRWHFIDKGPYYQWVHPSSGKIVRTTSENVTSKSTSTYLRALTDEPGSEGEFNIYYR